MFHRIRSIAIIIASLWGQVTHVIVCGAAHQESVWVQEPRTHNQPERFAASCHLARERREMPQEDLD